MIQQGRNLHILRNSHYLSIRTMGTYLEDYLESVYMLPSDVKRNFDLVRELDKTSYQLVEDLKDSHRKYLIDARKKVMARWADKEKDEPTEDELRALVETDENLKLLKEREQNVIQKLDEKVAIAAQSYELVDHHIRRLDQDLEAFGALFKQNGEFEEDMDDDKRISALVSTIKKKNVTSNTIGWKRGAGEANTDADAATNWDDGTEIAQDESAIDPKEPDYCHCRRVSFTNGPCDIVSRPAFEPMHFGPKLHDIIRLRLIEEVEGTSTGKYGYLITVTEVRDEDIGKGVIQDSSGYVCFNIRYRAILFRPFKNQVLDAVVSVVSQLGFFADVVPLQVFVSRHAMPTDLNNGYDHENNAWISDDREVEMRKKLWNSSSMMGVSIDVTEINAIGTIKDDQLGLISTENNS
ncbi:unnamed protein product [Albugo candida]|uniref:Inhibitor of growth protein N-terminal histone-binding domain-containing protein n=1 Tax=Albugo candida TaxID=65357 RepID=A0A024GPR2_9STRA|nr:unnamed protein product [Albugo candida]|eukprot:CCI48725.1 unnamed protein product [Albugo candida]